MAVRTPCSVAGCDRHRTHKQELQPGHRWVWMCRDHWRRIPQGKKRALFRLNRLRKRIGDTEQLCLRWSRTWDGLSRLADRLPPAEISEILGGM